MSDGVEIPVTVRDAFDRRRDLTARAEGGLVIVKAPEPGVFKLDPRSSEVEYLKNALDVAAIQALDQPRPKS